MGFLMNRRRPLIPTYLLRQPADHSRTTYSVPKNTTSTISCQAERNSWILVCICVFLNSIPEDLAWSESMTHVEEPGSTHWSVTLLWPLMTSHLTPSGSRVSGLAAVCLHKSKKWYSLLAETYNLWESLSQKYPEGISALNKCGAAQITWWVIKSSFK